LSVLGGVAGLQAVRGDRFLPFTYLDFEKMERTLQDQEGAVIQRRQRRLGAVMANQDKTR